MSEEGGSGGGGEGTEVVENGTVRSPGADDSEGAPIPTVGESAAHSLYSTDSPTMRWRFVISGRSEWSLGRKLN